MRARRSRRRGYWPRRRRARHDAERRCWRRGDARDRPRSCARPRRCSRCCTGRPWWSCGQACPGRTREARSSRRRRQGLPRTPRRRAAHAPRWYPDVAPCRMRDILPSIRARPSVSRLILVLAVLCTATAAWLSQGTIGFTGVGDARIALLPLSPLSLAFCAAAAAGVVAAWSAGASLAPLWLLVLVVLPWLPPSTPAVFLMWSGPLALFVWAAIALSLCASAGFRLPEGRLRSLVTDRPQLTAAALACAIYAVAAWQVSPSVPGGDEPHYLIITQSLLEDGDLKIENNHRSGDYRSYFAGDLAKPDFRRRGRNGEIYSIHAPGLPAMIAPAFALAGYHGVVVFLVLLASLGSALSWRLAWLVTKRADAAW